MTISRNKEEMYKSPDDLFEIQNNSKSKLEIRFNIYINRSNQGSEKLYLSDIKLYKIKIILYTNKSYVPPNLIVIKVFRF